MRGTKVHNCIKNTDDTSATKHVFWWQTRSCSNLKPICYHSRLSMPVVFGIWYPPNCPVVTQGIYKFSSCYHCSWGFFLSSCGTIDLMLSFTLNTVCCPTSIICIFLIQYKTVLALWCRCQVFLGIDVVVMIHAIVINITETLSIQMVTYYIQRWCLSGSQIWFALLWVLYVNGK